MYAKDATGYPADGNENGQQDHETEDRRNDLSDSLAHEGDRAMSQDPTGHGYRYTRLASAPVRRANAGLIKPRGTRTRTISN